MDDEGDAYNDKIDFFKSGLELLEMLPPVDCADCNCCEVLDTCAGCGVLEIGT